MSILSPTGIHEPAPVLHPDSDGKPMAENTKQFEWIQLISSNLSSLFADRPDVFVGGDLLWYPDKHSAEGAAPDILLAFGRPKGYRGSYKQWLENDVPVTVAFEIRSPGNDDDEMAKKFYFYDDNGVEEYYVYDPDTNRLEIFVRGQATFRQIHDIANYVSKRTGIRFEMTPPEMTVFRPDGKRFGTLAESQAETRIEREQKEEAQRQADEAKRQTDEAKRQTDEANRRADDEIRRRDLALARLARLTELSRKARKGHASAEELAELERLEGESAPG